jgi:hypothetical protein
MPKRSTTLQRIVAHIARQLAPHGAVVSESVEVREQGIAGTFREIDTLIEVGVGITRIRVAIECRERGRRASVQWIDELIGKYAFLPVDRILAVSAAGYSRAAALKAELHHIDLLHLRDIVESDWAAKFDLLTARHIKAFSFDGVVLRTSPQFSGRIDGATVRLGDTGNTVPVQKFCDGAWGYVITQLADRPDKYNSDESARAHIHASSLLCMPMTGSGAVLLHDSSEYPITDIVFKVKIEEAEIAVNFQALGDDALLTVVQSSLTDAVIVQVSGDPKPAVFVEGFECDVRTWS